MQNCEQMVQRAGQQRSMFKRKVTLSGIPTDVGSSKKPEFSPDNSGLGNSGYEGAEDIYKDGELEGGYEAIKSDMRFKRSSSKFNIEDSRFRLKELGFSKTNHENGGELDLDLDEDSPVRKKKPKGSKNGVKNGKHKGEKGKDDKSVDKEFFGTNYTQQEDEDENESTASKQKELKKSRRISLSHLIEGFFLEDFIEDFRCSHCKKQGMIKKTSRIIRMPEILIVTLKRFVFYPQMRKIHRPIFMHNHKINLKQHAFNPRSGRGKFGASYEFSQKFQGRPKEAEIYKSIISNTCFADEIPSLHGNFKPDFNLNGYIEHTGNMDNGHYIAFNRVEQAGSQGSFDSFRNGLKDSGMSNGNKHKDGKRTNEEEWLLKNDDKIYRILNHRDKLRGDNKYIYSLFFSQAKF